MRTVTSSFINLLRKLRVEIDVLAKEIRNQMKHEAFAPGLLSPIPGEDPGEAKANLMLAFRHMEDARMRLGKSIQAMDGGVSCYDRPAGEPQASPVPAPEPAGSTRPAYQQRVIQERIELDDKIGRLADFTSSEIFNGLSTEERIRLLKQLALMKSYSEVLGERITAFDHPQSADPCPAPEQVEKFAALPESLPTAEPLLKKFTPTEFVEAAKQAGIGQEPCKETPPSPAS